MVVKKKARREGTTTSSLMRSCLIKLNSFNSVHRGNKRARVCVCLFVCVFVWVCEWIRGRRCWTTRRLTHLWS